jgi:hypothetical protein
MAGDPTFAQSLPHLANPLTFAGGRFGVVEQDTDEHVSQCILGIVGTPQGSVIDDPTFGVVDPTFSRQPLDTSLLRAQIARQEPRAQTTILAQPDALDALIEHVTVQVSGEAAG